MTLTYLVICLSGCVSLPGKSAASRKMSLYAGPKARIAVGDFEIKAIKATPKIAAGLREMLIAALQETSHFYLLERQPNASLAQDKVKAPELIISATLVEFEPQTSGGKAGIGSGGGVGSGILGGLSGSSLNKAYLVLDIHMIDASTAKGILETKRIKGQASDLSGITEGALGNLRLNKELSGYANTPMEKAIRICVFEAARNIAETVPASYYKY